jgi:hypothetical protein
MAHGEEGHMRAVPLLNLKKAWVMKYQVCVRKTAVGFRTQRQLPARLLKTLFFATDLEERHPQVSGSAEDDSDVAGDPGPN